MTIWKILSLTLKFIPNTEIAAWSCRHNGLCSISNLHCSLVNEKLSKDESMTLELVLPVQKIC